MSAIKRDVEWLGFSWNSLCYASDYFDQLYDFAVALVNKGAAYVDSLSADEIREYRGTLKAPGKDSPYRDRTVAENLTLLEGMKNGEYDEGEHVLRLKIDMASSNINMRDPAILPHRRQVEYLSTVRLHTLSVGCDRGNYPFAVYTRIRGSSATV